MTPPHPLDLSKSADPLPDAGPSEVEVPLLWPDGLRQVGRPQTRWLWRGYLAAGSVTLLTSQWKAGKTTLLSLLLDRMKAGGEVAGRPLAAGKTVVVSEEGPEHWLRRSERLDVAGHVCWLCRPFAGKPTAAQWQALLGRPDTHPDGWHLTVAVPGRSAEVWDIFSGQKAAGRGEQWRRWEGENLTPGHALALRGDGAWLAQSLTRHLGLWEAADRRFVLALPGEAGTVRSLAWSRDGTRLAVGSSDGGLVVWDVPRVRAQLAAIGLNG